jgi:hypothetical protein
MQKIKYLDRDLQIQLIEQQFSKIFTTSNIDRNVVIEFLISDYKFTPNVQISPMKSPFTIMSPNEMGRPRIFSSSSDDLSR